MCSKVKAVVGRKLTKPKLKNVRENDNNGLLQSALGSGTVMKGQLMLETISRTKPTSAKTAAISTRRFVLLLLKKMRLKKETIPGKIPIKYKTINLVVEKPASWTKKLGLNHYALAIM